MESYKASKFNSQIKKLGSGGGNPTQGHSSFIIHDLPSADQTTDVCQLPHQASRITTRLSMDSAIKALAI